jgi:hypothetical protein
MHSRSQACALYESTLALGLLAKNPPTAAQLRTATAADDWAKLVARAHAALSEGGLGPAQQPFRRLVVALDGADASVKRRDTADFRNRLRQLLPTLNSTERAAERSGLRCTVRSTDGSASITFGASDSH